MNHHSITAILLLLACIISLSYAGPLKHGRGSGSGNKSKSKSNKSSSTSSGSKISPSSSDRETSNAVLKLGGIISSIAGVAGLSYIGIKYYLIPYINKSRKGSDSDNDDATTNDSKDSMNDIINKSISGNNIQQQIETYDLKIPVDELLSELVSIDNPSLLESFHSISKNTHICLFFDCSKTVTTDANDKKNRVDYFKLMENITTEARDKLDGNMFTIYIPASDNNLMNDKTANFRPNQWLSIPSTTTGQRVAATLREKFGISEQELRLSIVGPNYKMITDNAFDLLKGMPFNLPWPQQQLSTIIGDTFLDANGADTLSQTVNKNETIALYMSASWCEPCKKFLPKLISAYNTIKGVGNDSSSVELNNNFEALYVSLDQDEQSFNEYRAKMPFPALPFKSSRVLALALNIKSIPALIFLKNGQYVTTSGVNEVMNDEMCVNYPWIDKCDDLSSSKAMEKLQRYPTVIVLLESLSDDNLKSIIKSEIEKSAAALASKDILFPRSIREELSFLTNNLDNNLVKTIKQMCQLPTNAVIDEQPRAIVLDLLQETYAVVPTDNISASDPEAYAVMFRNQVDDFIRSYQNYEVPLKKLLIENVEKQEQP